MMRQLATVRYPMVILVGALAAVLLLYPIRVVDAADVATPVEAETFDLKPTGTSVVTDSTLYSNGQALKFSNNKAIAKEQVDFASSGDVVLMARAGQKGGSPNLRVSVNGTFTAAAQAITNSGAPQPYTFDVNAPSGNNVRIGVKAANTGTGRYPFLDYATFPPSGGGGGGSLTYIGSATGDTGTTPQVKVTVPVRPGTKQGDVMLALLQADYGNVGGTLPSGWKLIKEHLEGRDLSLHAYYKIAAAPDTEPSSYTWNVVNVARHPLAGGTILTFRGVDQASPVFANA